MAKQRNMTSSICVTAAELADIKLVAERADRTVSSWCYSQIMAACKVKSAAMAVASDHTTLQQESLPKGARSCRLSVIMSEPDHIAVNIIARKIGLSAHAFAQTCVVIAARRLVGSLDPAIARKLTSVKNAEDDATTVSFYVPPSVMPDEFSTVELTARMLDFLGALPQAIYHGQGPTLRGKIHGLVDRYPYAPGDPHFKLSMDAKRIGLTAELLQMDMGVLLRSVAIRTLKAGVAPVPPKTVYPEGDLVVMVTQKYVIDQRGNRASLSRWGDSDKATAALRTLKDCDRCTDCERCTGCVGCTGCVACKACTGCHNCRACTECAGCGDCRALTRCNGCTNCETMWDCERCRDCSNCMNVSNMTASHNLVEKPEETA